MMMGRLILACQFAKGQFILEGDYTFVRAADGRAYVAEPSGDLQEVVLDGDSSHPMVFPGQEGYFSKFVLTHSLEDCDRAVPEGTTIVMISGNRDQLITIFYGNGKLGMSKDGGDDLEVTHIYA